MENSRITKKVIGLMSGTSCDSIDAAYCLVYPDLKVELIKGINYSYPTKIRNMIFKAFRGEISIKELCQLNFLIGECFALASNVLIDEFGKPDFISSHGQTVYHYPENETIEGLSSKSTLQIGESSVISALTNCPVISNFREKDIALGGQGAPLVCFADSVWFKGTNTLVQNIGGISNVTVVSNDYEIFGFDTGCGNIMIDYCVNKFFNKKYDEDGVIALSGNVSEDWLNYLLKDEYYFKEPPKTTGREHFSSEYIEEALKYAPNEPKDIIATLTALTAKTIVEAYKNFIFNKTEINQVVLGGGGAYNPAIIKFLREYLPDDIELKTHEDFSISNNYKEAMAFALLGYCTYYNIPNNVPSCTGAKEVTVLGKITK